MIFGCEIMAVSLLYDYLKFEKIAKKYEFGSTELNASKESFLGPVTIVPLLCFAENNNVKTIYTHPNTHEFVNRILKRKETSTTIPFVNLPKSRNEYAEIQPATEIAEKINDEYGGYYTLFHICDELIGNIYNHTPMEEGYANQGYSFAQEYVNDKRVDICVMDDGLSIPGSFEKKGIDFEDDCHAICLAISGKSTAKDEEDDPRYSRGAGLLTTLRLVIEENGGEALIVSRRGLLYIKNKDKYEYRLLDNEDIFKGTLVAVKLKKNLVEHYHDVIELSSVKSKYIYNG